MTILNDVLRDPDPDGQGGGQGSDGGNNTDGGLEGLVETGSVAEKRTETADK